MTIILRPAHLKVASALLINIAAGLLLLALTVKSPEVLTMEIGIAIMLITFAVKIELILEEL